MRNALVLFLFFLISISHAQTIRSGVATHFEVLGSPYGGCGVPTELVGSEHFVALNVYDSPGVGTMWSRPLKGADTTHVGEFNNGLNCGRWVKVNICEDCIGGTNDGALGAEFCRGTNAKWVNDGYSGASLYMIVTDACGDNNAWCRDSKYHLDLHTSSVNQFELNGQPVNDILPTHFNNRKITWEYVDAPDYTGDIKIYFMQGAQYYWSSILITNLKNGIHGVEQKVGNNWVKLKMNSDMGQAYLMEVATPPYRIRVLDANNKYINYEREYIFNFPESCGNTCTKAATEVAYSTFNPITTEITNAKISDAKISSNYSSQQLKIAYISNFENNKIQLIDISGRIIKEEVAANTEGTIDVNSIPNGFYFIKLINQNKILAHAKIVLVK